MNDLVEFLLSCIAEDEQVAKAAITAPHGTGRWQGDRVVLDDGWVAAGLADRHGAIAFEVDDWGDAQTHVLHWDPWHVLAECDAKRKRVELHEGDHECPSEDSNCGWWQPGTPVWPIGDERETVAPYCPTLRLEALPYADRTGYRQEWRP